MAQRTTASINTNLASWLSDELNDKITNTKSLFPDTLNTVLSELYSDIRDINDSSFNKVDGITISDVSGLTSSLGGKESADPTILKQASIVNNLTSTSNSKPLSAAQGKVLKDSLDDIHTQNTDTELATGTASAVSASDLRDHLDNSNIHYAASTIDHTVLLNKGTNTHAQIDTHIANSTLHYAASTIDHDEILNNGSNDHAAIDTHIGASSAHGVSGNIVGTTDTQTLTNKTISGSNNTISNIDHTNLLNKGSNTHAQIDSHISSTSNPHTVTIDQSVTAASLSSNVGDLYVPSSTGISTLSVGTNNQVLTADSTQPLGVKWADSTGEANTLSSVGGETSLVVGKSGTALQVRSVKSNNSILTVSNNSNVTEFTVNASAIAHSDLSGVGSNTHAQIDNHISSTSNPHSTTGTQVLTQEGFTFSKGKIYVADGTDLNSLAVGSNNQVLTANSSTTTGLEWVDPTGQTNTASNLSTSGVGLYDSKSSSDLRFRRIDAGSSKVTVTLNTNKVDVDVVPSNINHQNLSGAGTNTHAQIDSHISNTSNPHSVTKTQIGLSNVTNTKNNFSATSAPGTGDDSADGYSVGSRWLDTTDDRAYVCLDATTSAAVWLPASITEQTALTAKLTDLTQAGSFTPDYAIQALTNSSAWGFASQDEAETVLSVILNLQTRVSELETKLQAVDILA